jgi:predicted dienelactone hydrolase
LVKRPLIMFSHGAGSNGLYYAWFGEYLASRGYLVALLYHYRANTYDATVMYTRSKLWQRPRDISLDITNLLQDKMWGSYIEASQIGVAGHGVRDTQAPARENSEFAAKYISHAQLDVLPGLVDHEIFVNECDALGRDTWPEACVDAPGIDRNTLH